MADIFVDPDSITNGTGSFADPRNIWPTSIGANDVIYLKGGTRLQLSAQIGLGGGSDNIVRGYYPAGAAPRPIISSTATNQSLIFVARPGVTTFDGIHFDQLLGMGANGGAIGTGDNGSGRFARLAIRNCRFTGIGQNAILLNSTTTGTAALTFQCIGNEFDDIGADCAFGAALQYEFAYNRCTNMSSRTVNGDAVGFITADPEFVWIHHNYVDHSNADTKQCIIIDTTTDGAGLCLIEDNILIGFGNVNTPSVGHNVIISDPVTTIRRNVIYAAGLGCGVRYASDRVTDNLFIVSNTNPAIDHTVAMVADGLVAHNTFVNINPAIRPTHNALAVGAAVTTAARIKNNAFVGMPTAIRNAAVANPNTTRNSYFNCATRRTGLIAYPEPSELLLDPMLTAQYRPRLDSPLIGAAEYIGPSTDLSGRFRGSLGSVGAFEFPA